MAEPARYTHGHHDSVLRSHRWRSAANSAAYLIDLLNPGQRLLDVGCGPGTITVDLARLVWPGPVVAIDHAPAAVMAARTAAAAAGMGGAGVGSIAFAVADVASLDHPDGTFDVVHAHQVLQHLTEPVAALREMRRVCAPGGVVAARDADYLAMVWHPADTGLDRWLELYRAVARANGGEPDAGRRLLGWAHAAGFATVTASASTWCYATPDDRAWWGGLWAERMTESDVAGRVVELGLASRRDLAEIAEAWRRWAGAPDGWFAVVHGEVLCRA